MNTAGILVGIGLGFMAGVGGKWWAEPVPRGPVSVTLGNGLTVVDKGYDYDYGISRPDELVSEVRGVDIDCGILGSKKELYIHRGGIFRGEP